MRTFTKLEKRLLGITSSEADSVCQLWLQGRNPVHPQTWSRKGRQLNGMTLEEIAEVLKRLGLRAAAHWSSCVAAGPRGWDFEMGNDSPRGGVEGNWIKLTPAGFRKINSRLA